MYFIGYGIIIYYFYPIINSFAKKFAEFFYAELSR